MRFRPVAYVLGQACGVALGIALAASVGIAQQRGSLPPPDQSRPPLLTEMGVDTIREQVVAMSVLSLVADLQRADLASIGAELRDVGSGQDVPAIQPQPLCQTVLSATAALAAALGVPVGSPNPSKLLPIYAKKVELSAAAATSVIKAELIFVPSTGPPVTGSVELTFDTIEMRWSRVEGLLPMLCDALYRVRP